MSQPNETMIGRRQAHVRSMVTAARINADALPGEGSAATLPWYVVYTKVRQEQTACENLARQGYVVYLPRIKIMKRSRGRQQTHLEPMFPRYIFVQPGSGAHSIAPVRSTMGVMTIVRFGQEAAVLRPDVLHHIRDFEACQNEAREADISPFQPGERIHVVDGPLTGLEGLISNVSQQRVTVLMHLLGRDTRVNLSHHQILIAH